MHALPSLDAMVMTKHESRMTNDEGMSKGWYCTLPRLAHERSDPWVPLVGFQFLTANKIHA